MTIGTLTRRAALLGAAVGAMMTALAGAVSAEAMTLKFSTMEPPQGPMVNCFTLPLLEELQAGTGGMIEIETLIGGTGFAHPLRQYAQVARGVMDISQGVLSYTPGQFSMTKVATRPLLVEVAEVVSRAINTIASAYLADEFEDIHLMAVLVTPPLFVHTRDAAIRLDDLAGQRIRSTGSGANAFLEALGAVPMQMPAPAVYENLQTGVIDDALSEFLALRSFRIGEVAEHHLLINATVALLYPGMNKAALAAMPEDVQELIRTKYSGPEVGARASACWNELGAGVVGDLKAQGHSFLEVSDADRARAEEIAAEITEGYIAELEAQGKPTRAFYDALIAEIDAQKMN